MPRYFSIYFINNLFRIFLLFALLLFCSFPLNGQQDIKFNRLNINDGLSNSRVLCILKDSKGYMWFGTADGLNRYDGKEFTCYRNDPKNSNTLSHNYVISIAEDGDGDIITCGSYGGISIFNHAKEKFTQYNNFPKDIDSLPDTRVTRILVDKNKNIWLGTEQNGLLLFNKNTKTLKKYVFYEHNTSSPIIDIIETQSGELLVLTEKYGLWTFSTQTRKFTSISNGIKDSPMNVASIDKSIYCDRNGYIWMGIQGLGLYKFDITGNIHEHYQLKTGSMPFPSNNIKRITEGEKGILWLATDGDGLIMLNTKQHTYKVFNTNINNPESISSNQLYSLYYDNTGILWIGNYAAGINTYDKVAHNFHHFKNDPVNPNSLSKNQTLCFHQDKEGNLWIGTDGGGLNLYNAQKYGNTFVHFRYTPQLPNSLSSDVIKTIFEDKEGILWLGTYNGGLVKFDKKNKRFYNFKANSKNKNAGPLNNHVWSVFEDSYGIFWISCLSEGLEKFDKRKEIFERPYKKYTAPISVFTIYEDRDRRLWFGSANDGLFLYNRDNDTFIRYNHAPGNPSTISGNSIFCIYQDSKKRLWIGTSNGGLNLLNNDGKTFTHYTQKDGLANNNICGILEDKKGNLWISTFKGISKFNPDSNTFRNYNKSDGLQSDEFIYSSYGQTDDGKFLFGGIEGFNAFYPDEIKDNPNVPKVVISDFFAFNTRVNVNDASGILNKNISLTSKLTLSYKTSVFSFKFACLNYTSPQKNQYAYYMDGFEKNWNYVGTKNEATYTNLDPGTYTFKVKACNNDGIWNENGTTLTITITPPWWKTYWFKTIFILFVLFSLFGYYKYRVFAIERKNRKLEFLVKKKTAEVLAEKEKQREEEEKNKALMLRQKELEAENLRAEKEMIQLKNEKYLADIQKKNAELASFALQITHKNDFLEKQKRQLEQLTSKLDNTSHRYVNQLIKDIEADNNLEKEWEQYEKSFEQVHENFIKKLKEKHPDITPKDIRLCTYLKLNISTKEIANLLSISIRGVEKSRSRLRKKMGLPPTLDLVDYMLHL